MSNVSADVKAKLDKLPDLIVKAQAKRKVKERATIFNKNLDVLWVFDGGAFPACFNAKVARGKARAMRDGKKLLDPGLCYTTCCIVCPFACGCTQYLPGQGGVELELPGSDAAYFIVNGAPAAHTDLEICKEALTEAGLAFTESGQPRGAPPATEMER